MMCALCCTLHCGERNTSNKAKCRTKRFRSTRTYSGTLKSISCRLLSKSIAHNKVSFSVPRNSLQRQLTARTFCTVQLALISEYTFDRCRQTAADACGRISRARTPYQISQELAAWRGTRDGLQGSRNCHIFLLSFHGVDQGAR